VNEKDACTVAKEFNCVWLSQYPQPLCCIHEQGSEFVGFESQELLESYGVCSSPTAVKNPTANAILERTHQTMSNMLRTADLHTIDFMKVDKVLQDLIAAVSFALRASYHTTMKATSMQLAFGRDMFFPATYIANWHHQQVQAIDQMMCETVCENHN
jgi:hypothetical protein